MSTLGQLYLHVLSRAVPRFSEGKCPTGTFGGISEPPELTGSPVIRRLLGKIFTRPSVTGSGLHAV